MLIVLLFTFCLFVSSLLVIASVCWFVIESMLSPSNVVSRISSFIHFVVSYSSVLRFFSCFVFPLCSFLLCFFSAVRCSFLSLFYSLLRFSPCILVLSSSLPFLLCCSLLLCPYVLLLFSSFNSPLFVASRASSLLSSLCVLFFPSVFSSFRRLLLPFALVYGLFLRCFSSGLLFLPCLKMVFSSFLLWPCVALAAGGFQQPQKMGLFPALRLRPLRRESPGAPSGGEDGNGPNEADVALGVFGGGVCPSVRRL